MPHILSASAPEPAPARALASALALTLALLAPRAAGSSPALAPAAPAGWSNVAIGGGGYVLQTFFHALTPHAYMKTDVGGVYRREADAAAPGGFRWLPLLDAFGPSASDAYSVSALAMGPRSGADLAALCGGYWAWSNCTVLLSADAGASWSVSPATSGWGLRCGGNEGDRAVGDRMAFHPANAGLAAVGGSDGRVYITTDGFASTAVPARVALPPPAAAAACDPQRNSSCVVRSVLWLPAAGGAQAATLLLAAVPAFGLFASVGPDFADAAGWSFVFGSDAPSEINRLAAVPGQPGRLWATAARGGVWRGDVQPDGAGGWAVSWGVAGALAGEGVPFSGIAVRGDGGIDVVVMSLLYDSNTTLFRSPDGGATFARQNWSVTSLVPWWGANDFNTNLNAASSLAFDPFADAPTPSLWATDFFGVYRADAPLPAAGALAADDSSASPLSFVNVETGHEEVCVNVIRAPAAGALLSGAADVGGWRHDQGEAAWPTATFKAADGYAHNCVYDIAHTLKLRSDGSAPDALYVTAGDEYGSCHGSPSWCGLHSWVGVSRDGGASFADTAFDSVYAVSQANPYRVAVHPFDGAKAVVAARSGLPVAFTRDYGATWANATGVVSVGEQGNFWFGQPLARENQIDEAAPEAVFYFYNGTGGLSVSSDSGASFATVYAGFPSWSVPFFGLATPPRGASAAGDLWTFAGWKLYHSINGGVNQTSVWSFYHPDTVIAVGPLPPAVSPSGRNERGLAALCAARAARAAAAAGRPPLPALAGAAYAVYVIGARDYDEPSALFASVDLGHSWQPLSGANSTTPAQGLGDTPTALEASAKQPGVLYVGTGGRGVFARDVSAELVAALLACERAEVAEGG
jgi:hypothetical protein